MVSLQNLQKDLNGNIKILLWAQWVFGEINHFLNNTNIKEVNTNYDTNEEKYHMISKQKRIEISTKISNFTRIDYQHRL